MASILIKRASPIILCNTKAVTRKLRVNSQKDSWRHLYIKHKGKLLE